MTEHADLLISGGTDRRRHGRAGPPGLGRRRRRAHPRPGSRATPPPEHVGRTIDATGKVVAPGFIDLHSHGGLMILADGRARAQGPPGRHDRARRGRWQRVRAVRAARGPRGVRRARQRPRRPPGHRLRLDLGRELPRALRRDGQPQRRHARRQLAAPDRGARLGRRPRRRRGARPDARRSCATRWPTGAFGLTSGLDYPPGSLRHDRGARRAHR